MNGIKSLFNDSVDLSPADDRREPIIWVRRVVVIERRVPEAEPIREVAFRPGLNIIATAEPEPDVDPPVGHNVGKTLLTRLIRYCLGEQHYARHPVREAIAREWPEAFVVAEIFLNGECWIVARPIGASPQRESACLRDESWRAILDPSAENERFSRFVEEVEQATVAPFSGTSLPHLDRAVQWRDLLAWLSRDQYCRYRHPLEWRTPWTESGTAGLNDEDASVLIRLVMDLLDEEELRLIAHHKALLTEKATKAAEVKSVTGSMDRTRRFLQERLDLDGEMLTNDLFGDAARTRAQEKCDQIGRSIEELDTRSESAQIEARLKDVEREVLREERTRDLRQADRQLVEGQLNKGETAAGEAFEASFADLGNVCSLPAAQCPLKDDSAKPGQRDPIKELLVREKTAELQRISQQLAESRERLRELCTARDDLKAKFKRVEQATKDQRSALETNLSLMRLLIEEAGDFRNSTAKLEAATAELEALERRLKQSRQTHHAAHEQLERRRQELNRHFDVVLQALMAIEGGQIRIDMRGVHLAVEEGASAAGEALTSEMALALDLACLSASISGLGHLPRFMIHDSPREADLEPHIYARLFRFISSLEDRFEGRQPSFQYIVATTTPPPAALNIEPFVRLRLDARSGEGLLLKRSF